MKIERTFMLAINEVLARQRIAEYFAQAGYSPVPEEGAVIKFKRGSPLGSWLSVNPSRFLSLAEIRIKPKGDQVQVQAEFDVKAIMRDDTHFTQSFLANEMNELGIALREGKYFPVRTKKLTLRAILAIFKSLGSPLAYIVIWAGLSLGITFLVMRLPGDLKAIPEIVAIGAMITSGVLTYFISRFWKKWRSSKPKNSATNELN